MEKVYKNNHVFSDEVWESLVNRVALFLHYNSVMRHNLQENELYKLAASIPFFTNTDTPLRYAIQNLLTIIVMSEEGVGKDIFIHSTIDDDNVFKRLMTLYHPELGCEAIQKRALALLAIVMLNDYCTDQSIDYQKDKYNPILKKVWNHNALRQQLASEIENNPCTEMDSLFSLSAAQVRSFWAS